MNTVFAPILLVAAATANAACAFTADTMLAMSIHATAMVVLFAATIFSVTRIAEGRV